VQSGLRQQKVYLNLKITHIEINERKIVISFIAVKDRNTHVRRYNLRTAGVVDKALELLFKQITREEIIKWKGSDVWEGDLDEMRSI